MLEVHARWQERRREVSGDYCEHANIVSRLKKYMTFIDLTLLDTPAWKQLVME